jgi:hypothetical protein
MIAHAAAGAPRLPRAAGLTLGLTGMGLLGAGLWGRRETRVALQQERIDGPAGVGRVSTAGGARAMAELVRRNTLEATGGRTYAETAPYVDEDGAPTENETEAARDARTGQPAESPDHALWAQSITLQTALMQGYMAFRLAETTMAIGAAFVVAGLGLAAAGRHGR